VLGMDEDKVCALQEDHPSTARPASRSSDSYIHMQEHLQRSLHKYYQVWCNSKCGLAAVWSCDHPHTDGLLAAHNKTSQACAQVPVERREELL
jgi:hypothetical protein